MIKQLINNFDLGKENYLAWFYKFKGQSGDIFDSENAKMKQDTNFDSFFDKVFEKDIEAEKP